MIRFSTVAANADVIGEDTPMAEPQRTPGEQRQGADDRQPPQRGRLHRERDGAPESGTAKPGQDINAAGFIKDKDAGKPV